jgi:uncharacterized phage protein gp47/JayE
MSYAAEPYAQFVEDLLTSLTGGVARERFVYIPEDAPFKLSPPGPLVPSTLRVYGQLNGQFVRFVRDTDFALTKDNAIDWSVGADGKTALHGTKPEEGTPFYVNYDHTGPGGATPILSDRNPGSVVRLLSESFAREYAVLSRQLEAVYKAGFLDTATGRDLEQLVALLGLARRDRTFAVGSVVFARSTPAPADVFIPAGTKLSTSQPPAVVFETSQDVTLHRGNLSIEAPIRAEVTGGAGAVPANLVTVIHRPILGIESAANPQATQLLGADESDDELRTRARRALETGGKSTVGALLGALATLPTLVGDALPQVREKDIIIQEDHANRPGVILLNVAAELSDDAAQQAIQLIEETRPAGVRVVHNLDVLPPDVATTPPDGIIADDEEIAGDATSIAGPLFFPVKVVAVVIPASATLAPADRDALKKSAEDALRATVAQAGVGEVVIYNRLVAAVMSLDGVLDVALQLFKVPSTDPANPDPPMPRHANLRPTKTLRPSVESKDGGVLEVSVGGQLVQFDVTIDVTLKNALLTHDNVTGADLKPDPGMLEIARVDISGRLRDQIYTVTKASPANLITAIGQSNDWVVNALSYNIWYRDAGVQLNGVSPEVSPQPEEILWINSVKVGNAKVDNS